MNYVELHIGDYEKATAHLTAIEDGIYGRLLRRYYDAEGPLVADLKALQRLVRARTRDERGAVENILEEFFYLADDGWHHTRCDEEIARYQAKREKAQASANARWDKQRKPSARNANASADAMRTHSGRNAHQSPVTSNPPDTSPARTDPRATTDAGRACRLMRDAGCPSTNPSHPDLLAALAEGVTPETLGDTAREAVDAGKPKPFPWAIATARGRQREGANPIATGPPGSKPAPSRRLAAIHALLDGVSDATQPELAERRDSQGLEPPGLPVPRLGSGG